MHLLLNERGFGEDQGYSKCFCFWGFGGVPSTLSRRPWLLAPVRSHLFSYGLKLTREPDGFEFTRGLLALAGLNNEQAAKVMSDFDRDKSGPSRPFAFPYLNTAS